MTVPFAPLTLDAYERFIWTRLASTARLWRADPSQVSGFAFQKAARVAGGCTVPFADEDGRGHQLWAILEWGPRWMELTLEERNQAWPEIIAGLEAIDTAVAAAPGPSGLCPSTPTPVPVIEAAPVWYLRD